MPNLPGRSGRRSAGGSRFPKCSRLLRPADFRRVFEGAERVGNRHLTLLARANGLSHPRLGLAISKKNVRRAVDRNRIKRQIRERFRAFQDTIGGFDVVVLARPGIAQLHNRDLRAVLDRLWLELAERCVDSSSP